MHLWVTGVFHLKNESYVNVSQILWFFENTVFFRRVFLTLTVQL
jgi:hypothetical protein